MPKSLAAERCQEMAADVAAVQRLNQQMLNTERWQHLCAAREVAQRLILIARMVAQWFRDVMLPRQSSVPVGAAVHGDAVARARVMSYVQRRLRDFF